MVDIGETLVEWEVPYANSGTLKLRSMSKKQKETRLKSVFKGLLPLMVIIGGYYIISGPGEASRFIILFTIVIPFILLVMAIYLGLFKKIGSKVKKHNLIGTKGVLIGPVKRSWEDFESYEANQESNTFTLYHSKKYQMKNLMMGNPFLIIKASDNFKEIDYVLSKYLRKEEKEELRNEIKW